MQLEEQMKNIDNEIEKWMLFLHKHTATAGLYSLNDLMKLRPGPTIPTDINEASKVIDLPILAYLTYNLFILKSKCYTYNKFFHTHYCLFAQF